MQDSPVGSDRNYSLHRVLHKESKPSSTPPANRGGGAVYPLTSIRLKVLRRCVRRGKPSHPTITLPLSTAEPRLYKCS
eukprot:732525-Pleurochrysis_carterae.AAC.1